MIEVRQRDMILWSTNLMAARFAAIQGCPGTWLKNPKYCYLPILMYKEHQSSYLCIGEISLSISNGCWKYRPSFIRDCLMKWNRWQTPQLLIPSGLSSLYLIWCFQPSFYLWNGWPSFIPPFPGQEFHYDFDHFIDKKRVVNTKFNTNLTFQAVYP